MILQNVYFFPSQDASEITEVGGKGLSLILGSREGLPVPPGFILSVNFFAAWFETLKKSKAWDAFLKSNKNNLKKACNSVKKHALQLSLTKSQKEELAEALNKYDEKTLWAVRSSSPEEDLEGSSFAGGYESILGVATRDIKDALKKAFASSLDYRVAVYKKENGLDITDPKIAVIVQVQIASETAGVGFSLNPVTNNYDEAIFNSNFGLGETVVSGIVTPDTFTVNKTDLKIKEKLLGKKEHAIFLTPTGKKSEKKDSKENKFSLSDSQVVELTKLIITVENLYQKPIDIEWAYADNKLYLLQARPITTYIPLSSELITKPGEKKRLYVDMASTIQGLYQPISTSGTSFFTLIIGRIEKILFLREMTNDINAAIPWISPGRMYINLSNLLKLTGKKKFTDFINIIDPLTSKTIQNLDTTEYISSTNKLKLLPVGIAIKLPQIAPLILQARIHPEKTHIKIQKDLKLFLEKTTILAKNEASTTSLSKKLVATLIDDVFLRTMPLFITGKLALVEMKQVAGKNLEHAFTPFYTASPNNLTTQMGLALYNVSKTLPDNLGLKDIEEGIKNNTLSPEFMSAWNNFITEYGHRGPLEIDLGAPRYSDSPNILIATLISMRSSKNANPEERFKKNQEERSKAYEYLYSEIQKKNSKDAKKFQKLYKTFDIFAGYRETHKYYMAFVINLIRQKILKEANYLYDEKRLESVNQIFYLNLEDIENAKNLTFNIIEKVNSNKVFLDKLARITSPPSVIDSRGLIIRPPKQPAKEGEVKGIPISPGIVKGQIKILHNPTEKPLLKGEVLVARATDPGWTPLFINASALILEVGGVLQHGALVAREYGIPCVAGVENATSLWKDGDLVEVNGTEGTIRLVS